MARIPLVKRTVIGVTNLLFPPVAVMLLTGSFNQDVLLNCVLFLLAVFPSHIHGFYISLTYFNRKRKVRRGVYPGEKRSGIWSERINNGGASRREVERMKYERDFGKKEPKKGRPGVDRRLSNRIEEWDDGLKETMAVSRQSSMNSQNQPQRRGMGSRQDSGRSERPVQQLQQRLSQQQPPQQAQITGAQQAQITGVASRNSSGSGSRPRSLTRQLSDRLEDQVMRRLEARERRRRLRDDDEEASSEEETEVGVPVMSVRRWR